MSNTSARTITVPTNTAQPFATGSIVRIQNMNTGAVTISNSGGVTVQALGGYKVLNGQYSTGTLFKIATDTWMFSVDTRGLR